MHPRTWPHSRRRGSQYELTRFLTNRARGSGLVAQWRRLYISEVSPSNPLRIICYACGVLGGENAI